jgi:hypothetical protein
MFVASGSGVRGRPMVLTEENSGNKDPSKEISHRGADIQGKERYKQQLYT